jgi:hypothetical protein
MSNPRENNDADADPTTLDFKEPNNEPGAVGEDFKEPNNEPGSLREPNNEPGS